MLLLCSFQIVLPEFWNYVSIYFCQPFSVASVSIVWCFHMVLSVVLYGVSMQCRQSVVIVWYFHILLSVLVLLGFPWCCEGVSSQWCEGGGRRLQQWGGGGGGCGSSPRVSLTVGTAPAS